MLLSSAVFCKEYVLVLTTHTVFPRIDRARTIYFIAVVGARTIRGRGLFALAAF